MAYAHIAALILVTVAAYFDVATHRIPNLLTYPSWALGLLLGGILGGWPGLANSGIGFAVCFMPLFLMFIGGTVGGGDVKLMGGVGALIGFPAGLNALISSILVGGFCAAIILLWQGRLFRILGYAASKFWSKVYPAYVPQPPPPEHKDTFPFGIAIALGTYVTLGAIFLDANTPANLLR